MHRCGGHWKDNSMICPIMSKKPDQHHAYDDGSVLCRKDCAWYAGSLEPGEINEKPVRGTCVIWGVFDRLNEIALNLKK